MIRAIASWLCYPLFSPLDLLIRFAYRSHRTLYLTRARFYYVHEGTDIHTVEANAAFETPVNSLIWKVMPRHTRGEVRVIQSTQVSCYGELLVYCHLRISWFDCIHRYRGKQTLFFGEKTANPTYRRYDAVSFGPKTCSLHCQIPSLLAGSPLAFVFCGRNGSEPVRRLPDPHAIYYQHLRQLRNPSLLPCRFSRGLMPWLWFRQVPVGDGSSTSKRSLANRSGVFFT